MTVENHPNVLFRFRTPARQVYLMARPAEGAGWSLNQMAPSQDDDSAWELLLPLRPGRHRVRYYVDDGRRTVYHEPTDEGELMMDGLDVIVDVPKGSEGGLFMPAVAEETAVPRGHYQSGDAATDEHRWAKLL